MTNAEKSEMLKNTIYQLYSKEGRSKSYISKLLEIDRKILSEKIKEWNFEEAEAKKHMTPSTEKFINTNRQFIKSQLDKDVPITQIAAALKVDRRKLYTIFNYDNVLKQAHQESVNRKKNKTQKRIETQMKNSKLQYDFEELEGEIWKPILGYENYLISNYGRIKRMAEKYKAYYLLKPDENSISHRLQIRLSKNGQGKTLQVARLVALTFLTDSHSEEQNTVNHKDGNIQNNRVDNLEWVSQAENNLHAYRELNRTVVNHRTYIFDKILYKGQYEFNTVAAFARFLGKSETQTRRYMDEPEKHDIKFIIYNNDNCND